ncbi:juvenile hormone esterase-like [Armigeres subalbatus]|uniref:juvenile hormone esterase-like n=1 Tax=Armigeres subalbatus TaxID=124917 RepID=UPI002ED2FA06
MNVSVVFFVGGLLTLGGCLEWGEDDPGVNPCVVKFVDNDASGIGVLNRTFNGVKYCEYLGIRYAEPPVGPLRFKSSVVRAPEGAEQYTRIGSICAQLNTFDDAKKVTGDEDCLFLNIYKPLKNEADKNLYPVLVYIHGGSYAIWSPQTDMFGVDLLMESGIMIVAVNYRLSVLGFLHYPEFNITGNYGLKDHLAALQWVQRYIEPFGGDPNNVTLMGQSVGAHSVTYHMYLEPFQGLFHRAIAMSGSVLAPSAMIYNPEHYTSKYLKSINIHSYDELMNASFKDLFSLKSYSRKFSFAWASLPIFLPAVEDDDDPEALVTQPVHELILNEPVNKVPLMIGMTSLEFTSLFATSTIAEFTADESFPNRSNKTVYQEVKCMIEAAGKLANKVQPKGAGRHFYGKLANLVNMYYPVKMVLRRLSQMDAFLESIFYYRFEFDGKFGKYKNSFYKGGLESSYRGAIHGDDLGYLFSPYVVRQALANRSAFETEWNVSKRNVRYFSNFVKFGNPTPEDDELSDIKWPAYNGNETAQQFLNINDEDDVQIDDDRSNFVFQVWNVAHQCLYYYRCLQVDVLKEKIDKHLLSNQTSIDLDKLFVS